MSPSVFRSTGAPSPRQLSFEHEPGDVIFREGDLGTEMYVIQEGEVEIVKAVEGKEKTLAVLDKGDFFGEMALLEELPRTATARARSAVKVLQIDGSTFDRLLRNNPEIAVRMMRKLSRRLRAMDKVVQRALGSDGLSLVAAESAGEPARAPEAGTHWLFHEASGMRFYLAGGRETTVGRHDPVTGIRVDIDVTDLDPQRSTSRRHAKILRLEDGHYVAEEIGTMNGTFVNGERVKTGVPVAVKPGDQLRFGLVSLVLQEG